MEAIQSVDVVDDETTLFEVIATEQPPGSVVTLEFAQPPQVVDAVRVSIPRRRKRSPEREETDFDVLRKYLDEIGEFPLLTKDDEAILSKKVMNGLAAAERLAENSVNGHTARMLRADITEGQEAKRQFLHSNLRLVVSIAKKYSRSEVPLLDLIQEGNIGLEHAIDMFDWRKGFKFSTYATWWIRQAITRSISNTESLIRKPVHVGDNIKTLSKYERAGFSDAEIARAMQIEPNELANLRYYRTLEPDSLNAPLGDSGEAEVQDLIGDPRSSYGYERAEDTMVQSELLAELKKVLTRKELHILSTRFGLESGVPKTLDEVGAIIGATTGTKVSREHVRHVEQRALIKLMHPSLYASMLRIFPVEDTQTVWKEDAACAGVGEVMFLIEDQATRPKRGVTVKKDIRVVEMCDKCPVKEECQEYATEIGAKNGVWGGVVLRSRGIKK